MNNRQAKESLKASIATLSLDIERQFLGNIHFFVDSARLCVSRAVKLLDQGDVTFARDEVLKAAAYTYGMFNEKYTSLDKLLNNDEDPIQRRIYFVSVRMWDKDPHHSVLIQWKSPVGKDHSIIDPYVLGYGTRWKDSVVRLLRMFGQEDMDSQSPSHFFQNQVLNDCVNVQSRTQLHNRGKGVPTFD
jgi:hypothetical protein